MKVELTGSTKILAIETDCEREITVIENYDANSDSYLYSMIDVNTDEELSTDDKLYNDILNEINQQSWEK